MTIIDSHMHLKTNGFSIKKIISYLNKERIDCCWLLSWEEINHGHWPYHNLVVEDVYNAYLIYPKRIIPFYAPDPNEINAPLQLENWNKKGIRGCGELKATLNWDSDKIKSLLEVVNRLKLPVVFHMEESEYRHLPYSDALYDKILFYGLNAQRKIYQIPQRVIQLLINSYKPLKNRTKSYFFPGYMLDFASLESSLLKYPDINFIGHGPMFWKYFSTDADTTTEMLSQKNLSGEGIIWRLLREYTNLYADISGISGLNALVRNIPNAKKFLSTYEDKILYGTDNCMKGQRKFLNSLELSKTTYQKIYGDNALKLVNV